MIRIWLISRLTGKPDPVKNCSTSNVNSSAFQISCAAGFNGGLPQNFTIEVVESETMDKVVFSGSRQVPSFTVSNLRDSTDYRVYIVPVNMKGTGQPQGPQGTLVRTLTAPQPITAEKPNFHKENQDEETLNPVMVIIFGGASGLVLIVVTITLAVRVRCARRRGLEREDSKVVVTTIADLEFQDDHLTDRVPLRSSKSGLTNSASQDSAGAPAVSPTAVEREAGGGFPQDSRPYLMFPPGGHGGQFYTLRKHPAQQPLPAGCAATAGFAKPPDRDHKLPQDSFGVSRNSELSCRRNNFSGETAEEAVAQYREQQKAGFMYGTLRRPLPGEPAAFSAGLLGGFREEQLGYSGHTAAQSVVPPPPMFEEGNVNQKTPLLAKKSGKTEKKDKMESRV